MIEIYEVPYDIISYFELKYICIFSLYNVNTFLGPESLACLGRYISLVFKERNKKRLSVSFDIKLREPFRSIGKLFFIQIVWIQSPIFSYIYVQ